MRKREEIDRKLNEALLHAMVPKKVAEKLKAGRKVMPEEFPEVTIFFSDVEGFTNICAQVRPIQVVNMLNELYTVMDYCTSLFPLYKVETIGDAYMLVGGLPEKDPKHAQAIANFALTVCTAVGEVRGVRVVRVFRSPSPHVSSLWLSTSSSSSSFSSPGEKPAGRHPSAHPHGDSLRARDGRRGGQSDAALLPLRRHGEGCPAGGMDARLASLF